MHTRGAEAIAPGLRRCERGAVMVLALLMALWLVAILYYLLGIGEVLLFRTRLQQAADAGVYASAVTHARGMNLIALINMAMAALLGILVALRITFVVSTTVAAILAAMSWICPPCGAAAAPTAQVGVLANQAYQSLKEPIYRLLEVLHCSAVATAAAMPGIAQAKAIRAIRQEPSGGADGGVVWPIYQRLPVQDGSSAELCKRAGEYAGGFIADVTVGKFLPPAKKVIGGSIGALAKAAAPVFCGTAPASSLSTDFSSPIDERQDLTEPLPPARSPAIRACDAALSASLGDSSSAGDGAAGDRAAGDVAACDQAALDRHDAFAYDEQGNCLHEACEQRMPDVHEVCRPRAGKRLQRFTWQEREVEVSMRRVGNHWVETGRTLGEMRVAESDRPPCGTVEAMYGTSWHSAPGQTLCVDSDARQAQLERGETQVRYTEVVRVLHCELKKSNRLSMQVKPDKQAAPQGTSVANQTCSAGESSRVPQAMPSDIRFGDERLQLRSIVVHGRLPFGAEQGVGLAAWKAGRPRSLDERIGNVLVHLGHLQVAQAEFYFDGGDAGPGEWLWHMHWRARFRRFRLPDGGGMPSSAMSLMGGNQLADYTRLLIH